MRSSSIGYSSIWNAILGPERSRASSATAAARPLPALCPCKPTISSSIPTVLRLLSVNVLLRSSLRPESGAGTTALDGTRARPRCSRASRPIPPSVRRDPTCCRRAFRRCGCRTAAAYRLTAAPVGTARDRLLTDCRPLVQRVLRRTIPPRVNVSASGRSTKHAARNVARSSRVRLSTVGVKSRCPQQVPFNSCRLSEPENQGDRSTSASTWCGTWKAFSSVGLVSGPFGDSVCRASLWCSRPRRAVGRSSR